MTDTIPRPAAPTTEPGLAQPSRAELFVHWVAPALPIAIGYLDWRDQPAWTQLLMTAVVAAIFGWLMWIYHQISDPAGYHAALADYAISVLAHPDLAAIVSDCEQRLQLRGRMLGWQIVPCPHADPAACREPACHQAEARPAGRDTRTSHPIIRVGEALTSQPAVFAFTAARLTHQLTSRWRPVYYRLRGGTIAATGFVIGCTAPTLAAAASRYLLLIAVCTVTGWIDDLACDRAGLAASPGGAAAYLERLSQLHSVRPAGPRRLAAAAAHLVQPASIPASLRIALLRQHGTANTPKDSNR